MELCGRTHVERLGYSIPTVSQQARRANGLALAPLNRRRVGRAVREGAPGEEALAAHVAPGDPNAALAVSSVLL